MAAVKALSACLTRLPIYSSSGALMLTQSSRSSALEQPRIYVPEPPKRPLNAYITFSQKRRQDVLRSQPGLNSQEVINKLALEWKLLDAEEKKQYETQSAKEFLVFKKLHEKWWKSLSFEQQDTFLKSKEIEKQKKDNKRIKKQLRLLGKPRKPRSAFNFFLASKMNQNKDKAAPKDLFKEFSQKWKALSDKEKEPYVDMELKDLERHATEQVSWKEKLQQEGNSDILQQLQNRIFMISLSKKKA